jgi:thioredoxin-like negative regulator of GroEL
MDTGDFKTASVCYARLLQGDPSNCELAFNLAQTLQAIDQPEGAPSLMGRLASAKDGGYAPAHLWLAQQALSSPTPSHDAMLAADQQIAKAMQQAPEDPEVNCCAAILYAREGKWDEAAAAAAKTGDRLTGLTRQLHDIAVFQGNTSQAANWNTSSARH